MRTAWPEMELTQLSPVTAVTFNYDYYEDNCQYHHLQHMSTFLPVLYTVVFLVGIIGNSILIVALVCKRRIQRLIDIFIINLAASDFIFLITLPFWVDKEASDGSWRVGSFLCKASSYIISVNMYCSILLLTCMSADRYLAIMYPSTARRVRTRSYASGLCISVWLLSCCLGMPTLLSRELKEHYGKTYCTDKAMTEAKQIASLMILILAFFFPLLSILTFYCSITRKLCVHYQKSGKHDKKLRKSIKIVFIVVAAFVISWVPFNLFKLMAILWGLLKPPDCFPDLVAQLGMKVSSPFAFANSCANPFIYYCFDNYIRRAMIRCLCPWVKLSSSSNNSDTLDTRLSHSLSNFVVGEYATRKRKRSVSL
ncbi:G-protein coupled receptor 15 [Apteryx mantelli]|uniref:G-protein coupled receptor 15 n=1 Tax=Apteryx mantelli TaxID=2696672 RepID=A0A8B7J385_9AVES|nr:PREDICTED: G-protein coupled receptor 15 [Apteryx mantelli mantelli]XP_025938328.1 G-protein coupled receptor 15 isoform X1 [Apteryx rowi]